MNKLVDKKERKSNLLVVANVMDEILGCRAPEGRKEAREGKPDVLADSRAKRVRTHSVSYKV